MLVHLPNGHDCESVRDGLIATIATLPAHLRGSLTWDQGAEMAQHKQFSIAADMAVYSCDPASPWQRGSNENGLLRHYFPKGHRPVRALTRAAARSRHRASTMPWHSLRASNTC